MPETSAPTSPRCPAHQRPAVVTCARCGTFLCDECTELLGEAAYCASCLPLVRGEHGPLPQLLLVAFGLGVMGVLALVLNQASYLFRMLVPGVVFPVLHGLAAALGLWVPRRTLRRIHQGLAPRRARVLAQSTRALAVVNLLVFLLWVVALVSDPSGVDLD